MGGTACQIIIQGQALTGSILGAYNVVTYGNINITENDRKEILDYLESTKEGTEELLVRVRDSNNTATKVGIAGSQVVGNLNALCDSATNKGLNSEEKEEVANYLEERNKVGEKWLKFLLKKAKENEY